MEKAAARNDRLRITFVFLSPWGGYLLTPHPHIAHAATSQKFARFPYFSLQINVVPVSQLVNPDQP